MTIDFLTFSLQLDHQPFGEWYPYKKRKSRDVGYGKEPATFERDDGLGSFKAQSRCDGSQILFYGNPTKFLAGQNVCGPNKVSDLAIAVVKIIRDELNLPIRDRDLPGLVRSARLSRVDYAWGFRLSSSSDVGQLMTPLWESALFLDPNASRHGRGYIGVNMHSTVASLKMYDKGEEVKSEAYEAWKEAEFPNRQRLLRYASTLLRFEMTMRGKWLKKNKLRTVEAWDGFDFRNFAFEESLQVIGNHKVELLTPNLYHLAESMEERRFLSCYQHDPNYREVYSRRRLSDLRQRFKRAGLDIYRPYVKPTPMNIKVAELLTRERLRVSAPRSLRWKP